ncbi:hypothetical protein E2320_002364 [Naja naja]|nr:hypothetical protein E2320_002364 [Naja naja]
MATSPTFTSYNPTSETWDSYINSFECYIEANDLAGISSNRKKVSFYGAEVFEMANALLAPQTIQLVSWNTLQSIPRNHYAPKPSRIVCQHALNL